MGMLRNNMVMLGLSAEYVKVQTVKRYARTTNRHTKNRQLTW